MARIDDLRIDDDTTPPVRPRRRPDGRWLAVLAVLLLAVALGAVALLATRSAPDAAATASASDRGGALPAEPAARPAAGGLTAGGYVEVIPPGPTVVSTRTAGWIAALAVVEGATVTAGEVLATLDDTVPRQRLAEATAEAELARARLARLRAGYRSEEIAEAEAQHEQAAAREAFARSEVRRLEQLAAIGAVAERELLAARADLASAEADLAAAAARLAWRRTGTRAEDLAVAEAELARAEAAVARLDWQVAQCVVRAPIDGVVLERFVRVGDWVAPAEDGGRQGALLTLFDPQRLQVWVDVNQRDAEQVTVGQAVWLRADAWRGRSVAGRVAAIMPRANLQRNTVEVKIEILPDQADQAGSQPWLRPEMSVQVTFLADAGTRKDTQP